MLMWDSKVTVYKSKQVSWDTTMNSHCSQHKVSAGGNPQTAVLGGHRGIGPPSEFCLEPTSEKHS